MKPAPGRRRRLPALPVLLLMVLFLPFLPLEATGTKDPIIPLQEGHASQHNESQRFCYTNTRVPRWNDIWTRTQIRVTSSRMIRVSQVDSEEELERFSVWNVLFSFLRGKLNDTSIDVDLYSNKTCLKVELLEPGTTYSVVLVRRFDPKLFLVFFLGLLLFFCGDTLSRSQIFYYSAGISVGLLASLLVLVYMMSKVMPKKSPVYFLLVGGWSFSLYLLQLIFKNLREICKSYWQYLLGYLLLVGLLSFAVCYRRMQSSKLGPSPPRLLSEEEYRLQGEVETQKALAELRSVCRSPEFSAWTTVSRIQSPKRFADFVGGASHVTPMEVSAHEREFGLASLSIDEQLFEEDDDDEEEEEEVEENVHDSFAGNCRSDSLPHNHLDVQ
ncbi:nuclear envelope integral membrane protein 1 isoform X2 [Hirundo rustica]|uniref:nuclear envelope integral membrane protein 1 isoform X2 n=1 Tax=Hirundo rustica TaxID=43150 RepID=UPI001A94D135|nr:nuclear envelope integral membrane protein 1 isoform X2 [Hirundo rustica]